MDKCILCGFGKPPYEEVWNRDTYRVQCPRCGEYIITEEALLDLDQPKDFIREHLHLLSAVARRSWDRKERLRIDADLVQDRSEFEAKILSQCPRSTQEKMNEILRHVAARSKYPGEAVQIVWDNDRAYGYCSNDLEMEFFLRAYPNNPAQRYVMTAQTR